MNIKLGNCLRIRIYLKHLKLHQQQPMEKITHDSHMIHTWLTLSKDLLSICVLNLFLKWLCSVHHVGTKYPIRHSEGCKEISLSMMKVKDHNLCRRGITWRSKMPKVSPGTLPLLYSWKFMKIQNDRQYKTIVMPQRYLMIPMFAKYK